ncbi:uncharacterized protein LOC116690094 isoform X2 [Etheostoma spectabile]|uniref:uncharacterized protein LOC116690094 isoform X2 n=1 Tax=Etheostoma spectabile TaxID=54343 RepID=UPI0013AF6B67|nr:uncharacterized protein LOC116690094 isoform X2 [Etheostoma spectabile]
MDNQNKDGDSDRESYGLKISELLKALDNRKSPTIDPRNISSTLQTMGTGISNTNGTLRSRAFLPENISQLSKSQFKRRDHLREHEMHPHVLGVQAWTTQQLCDPLRTLPEQFPQTEPTSEWFFEDLTDLQMKLFSGALKKSGVPRNSQTVRKTHQNPHLYQSVEDKDTENK